ncbi:hypothetical protein BGZ94_009314 [Podila epigama]|nr:hypothetical protein BGZ94_009314 [Podila epigama]
MSPSTIVPIVTTDVPSAEIAKVLENSSPNSFVLFYFDIHGLGATARALFAYAGVEWKEIHPSDWYNVEKPLVKFGTLPVLYEISPPTNGKSIVVEHAEAMALELRLARKFNFLGANAFEESQILSVYSNSRAIMHRLEDAYFVRAQHRIEERDKFLNEKLPIWIKTHEALLTKNGSNGLYVGSTVTLAEIKTATVLDILLHVQYDFKGFEGVHKLINSEATPNLWKLREVVQAKKSYADWIASDEYKRLTKLNHDLYDEEYAVFSEKPAKEE